MRISNLDPNELYGFVDEAGLQVLMTASCFIHHYGDLPCTPDEFFPKEVIYIDGGFLF